MPIYKELKLLLRRHHPIHQGRIHFPTFQVEKKNSKSWYYLVCLVEVVVVGPYSRSWHGADSGLRICPRIVLEERIAVTIVATRELECRTWSLAVVAANNLNVGALEEELATLVRLVRGDVFNAHQVLSRGNLSWKLECELFLAPREPRWVGGGTALMTELIYFEPVSRSVVIADITWRFGEIDLHEIMLKAKCWLSDQIWTYLKGAWVSDLSLDIGSKADNVLASDNFGCFWLGFMVLWALVAAQVIAV